MHLLSKVSRPVLNVLWCEAILVCPVVHMSVMMGVMADTTHIERRLRLGTCIVTDTIWLWLKVQSGVLRKAVPSETLCSFWFSSLRMMLLMVTT